MAIFGSYGKSLHRGAAWVSSKNAQKYGAKAEQEIGFQINQWANLYSFDVFHDLKVPLVDYTVNIDHLVLYGDKIRLIDSKSWAKGFYITMGQKCYRSTKNTFLFERFDSGSKKTMQLAVDKLSQYLAQKGLHPKFQKPILIITAGNSLQDKSNFMFYCLKYQKAVNYVDFIKYKGRYIGSGLQKKQNPYLVQALKELLL